MAKFKPELSITGIQEAQAANLQVIAALQPEGALGRAIQYGTLEAHRYAVAVTHVGKYRQPGGGYVGGGALRGSHRAKVEGLQGSIYIDPTTINPRRPKGARPAEYGVYEHKRGGSHAFYQRVVDERGERIGTEMMSILIAGLP
jgi:hypothetical protein